MLLVVTRQKVEGGESHESGSLPWQIKTIMFVFGEPFLAHVKIVLLTSRSDLIA